MEISEIKNKLLEQTDRLVDLIGYYGFHNIRITLSEIRCSHDEDSNASSVRIKLIDGIPATDFSRSISGDIFTLITESRNERLYNVILKAKELLGISAEYQPRKKVSLFGGVYSGIRKSKDDCEPEPLKTYNEEILNDYNNGYSLRFLRDGISLRTQKHFNVGYDKTTDRITVPHYSFCGELVGVMGRYNGNSDEVNAKWFPLIAFPKSRSLYGFYQNYNSLFGSEKIFIGESEKFVMQLHTIGYKNAVALGGNSISKIQIKQLVSMYPKEIIFSLDEGLDINLIISQCLKAKEMCSKFGIKVGYMIDKNYKYIEYGSKKSPSDNGKDAFDGMIKECIIYV